MQEITGNDTSFVYFFYLHRSSLNDNSYYKYNATIRHSRYDLQFPLY